MVNLLFINIIILCFNQFHLTLVSQSSYDFCNVDNDPVFWKPTQNCQTNDTYDDKFQLQRYDNTAFSIFTVKHDNSWTRISMPNESDQKCI